MQLLNSDAAPEPGFSHPLLITFDNRGERLIGFGARNAVLRILTLGMYTFWAKTDVRRKLWSFTKINGEPLEYTGTGKELFQGFLTVFGFVILPLLITGFAVTLVFGKDRSILGLYQLFVYGVFFLLLGNALYRAQRYRLSRTRWRGIRGALTGSPARYGWTYFWTAVLPFAAIAVAAGGCYVIGRSDAAWVVATAGFVLALWVFPWRANLLQTLLICDMHFGDRKLTYTGTSGPLYTNYLFAWLGTCALLLAAFYEMGRILFRDGALYLPRDQISVSQIAELTLIPLAAFIAWALITAWYRAAQTRHFAKHTHFEGATFRSDISGKGLMWLTLTNWVLTILGLLMAVLVAGAALYAFGVEPVPSVPGARANDPGPLAIAIVVVSFVFFSTLMTTFAQFRSARYFMSRLKLDGHVNLSSVLQSGELAPNRGEGLAQMFDLDAF